MGARTRFLTCAILVYATSALSSTLLPISVGGLAKSGLSAGTLSTLAFLELGAAALAAIGFSFRLAAATPLTWCIAGCFIMAGGDVTSAFVLRSIPGLFVMRAVAGLGTGLMMASILASIARVREPERIYSYGIIGMSLLIAAGFWLAPELYELTGSAAGIYGFQAFMSLVGGIAMLCNYDCIEAYAESQRLISVVSEVHETSASNTGKPIDPRLFAQGFFVILLIATADSAIWVFATQIGELAGVTETGIGNAILVGTLVGSFAAPFAARVGEKVGLLIPIALAMVVTVLCMLVTVFFYTPLAFRGALCLRLIAAQILTPMYQGLYARIDSRGRLVAATVAALQIGVAIGPLFAAPLADLELHRFVPLGVGAASLYGVSFGVTLLMLHGYRRSGLYLQQL